MTDEVKPVLVENQNHSEGLASENKSTPSEQPSVDVIPRHHVTDIVKRERLEAYHKGKKDALAEMKTHEPANVGLGGMQEANPQQIQQLIAKALEDAEAKRVQEAQMKQQQDLVNHVASQFNAQMVNGRVKHNDFDEKVKELDFANMPQLVHMATDTGMADEIMYDLANNPQKITHLTILAHTQPKLAKLEMQKLAASIKANDIAKQQASPKEPLSQVTPSPVGTDSGQLNVRDFQKMFASGNY